MVWIFGIPLWKLLGALGGPRCRKSPAPVDDLYTIYSIGRAADSTKPRAGAGGTKSWDLETLGIRTSGGVDETSWKISQTNWWHLKSWWVQKSCTTKDDDYPIIYRFFSPFQVVCRISEPSNHKTLGDIQWQTSDVIFKYGWSTYPHPNVPFQK